jgi:hypothetical protein
MSNIEPTIESGLHVENHRAGGRLRLGIVGIVALSTLVVGGVLFVLFVDSAESTSTRLCDAAQIESGCVLSVPLDVTSLELFDQIPWGFAISPDTRSVLVSFTAESNDRDTGHADRLVVAEFDTSSGQVRHVLIDVVGRPGEVVSGAVAYSPDGTLAVASTLSGSSSQLDLFDMRMGAPVTTIGSVSDTRCRYVGLSPDGRLVQCDDSVFSIADGSRVERSDGFVSYLDEQGISRTGLTASFSWVENPGDFIEITSPSSSSSGELIARFSRERLEQERIVGDLNFDPSGRYVLNDFTVGPTVRSAVTHFVLYDVETGASVWNSQLGFKRWELAWNENGALAALSLDLDVAVFQPKPLR